jgi:hypothetical protein
MSNDPIALPNPEIMVVVQGYVGRDQVSVHWAGNEAQYRDPMKIAAVLRLAADTIERGRLTLVSPPPDEPSASP